MNSVDFCSEIIEAAQAAERDARAFNNLLVSQSGSADKED
jgi:hypothetical protein